MSLTLLDWRRRVAALYAEVRRTADPRAAHQVWRAGRAELFAGHPDSPDRSATLTYADYDPAMRFVAEVDPEVEPRRLSITTGTDGVVGFERIGQVQLGVGSLDVWWLAGYGGGIWLPVRDPSPRTYGGGRYVLDTAKGADLGGDVDPASGRGALVVDLNFAYNPSCAYDARWACPLAPDGNVVDVALEAGELVLGA